MTHSHGFFGIAIRALSEHIVRVATFVLLPASLSQSACASYAQLTD
jgi:hypothetical protein